MLGMILAEYPKSKDVPFLIWILLFLSPIAVPSILGYTLSKSSFINKK